MRQILVAVAIALTVSILLTPALIRLFTKQGFGHQIREAYTFSQSALSPVALLLTRDLMEDAL